MQTELNRSWAEPFTFAGAAAFARVSWSRLLTVQGLVAMLAAVSIVLFCETAWVPVFQRTIAVMPPSGEIKQGELSWPPTTSIRTAGTSFLCLSIDPTDALEPSEGADLQLELGKSALRCRSLFGFLVLPYPLSYRIAVNRSELEPWWGAWHPAIAAGLGMAVVAGLFVTWATLALIYAWPIRMIAFYADRELTWFGAWKLGAACLLPGAMLFSVGVVGYTLHSLNLVQLLGVAALHLMLGWIYVLFAPFSLPRKPLPGQTGAAVSNPFREPPAKKAKNPFT